MLAACRRLHRCPGNTPISRSPKCVGWPAPFSTRACNVTRRNSARRWHAWTSVSERAPAAGQAGANHLMSVDPVVADRLKQVAQRAGVTLFTVLLAALETVLAPYADGPDFVIAVPVAGRGSDGADGVIGPFANIVGLKTNLRAGQTMAELLADVGRQLLDTLGMRWCAPAIPCALPMRAAQPSHVVFDRGAHAVSTLWAPAMSTDLASVTCAVGRPFCDHTGGRF